MCGLSSFRPKKSLLSLDTYPKVANVVSMVHRWVLSYYTSRSNKQLHLRLTCDDNRGMWHKPECNPSWSTLCRTGSEKGLWPERPWETPMIPEKYRIFAHFSNGALGTSKHVKSTKVGPLSLVMTSGYWLQLFNCRSDDSFRKRTPRSLPFKHRNQRGKKGNALEYSKPPYSFLQLLIQSRRLTMETKKTPGWHFERARKSFVKKAAKQPCLQKQHLQNAMTVPYFPSYGRKNTHTVLIVRWSKNTFGRHN